MSHRLRRTCLIAAAVVLLGAWPLRQAEAIVPSNPSYWQEAPTLEDWIRDLEGDDKSDRLFAARELRRQLAAAQRRLDRGRGDELRREEDRVFVGDLRIRLVGPARRALVAHKNVRRPCADILGLLGDPSALPDLRFALEVDQRRSVQKHVQRAVDEVES